MEDIHTEYKGDTCTKKRAPRTFVNGLAVAAVDVASELHASGSERALEHPLPERRLQVPEHVRLVPVSYTHLTLPTILRV